MAVAPFLAVIAKDAVEENAKLKGRALQIQGASQQGQCRPA
jgi:hypothetical protein